MFFVFLRLVSSCPDLSSSCCRSSWSRWYHNSNHPKPAARPTRPTRPIISRWPSRCKDQGGNATQTEDLLGLAWLLYLLKYLIVFIVLVWMDVFGRVGVVGCVRRPCLIGHMAFLVLTVLAYEQHCQPQEQQPLVRRRRPTTLATTTKNIRTTITSSATHTHTNNNTQYTKNKQHTTHTKQ